MMYGRLQYQKIADKIKQVFGDFAIQGHSKTPPFSIGGVEHRMKRHARENNIPLAGSYMYFDTGGMGHSRRESKVEKGIAVSVGEIALFPMRRFKLDLYYDSTTRKYTYVDNHAKYIINPSHKIKIRGKKEKHVVFVTAQELNENEKFTGSRFTKL